MVTSAVLSCTSQQKVLVVIDCEITQKVPSLDLSLLQSELEKQHGTIVLVTKNVQHQPEVEEILAKQKPQRLILGISRKKGANQKIQALARKAGLDPLGIQVVELGAYSRDTSENDSTKLTIALLQAMIARVQAFPGSQPENVKSGLVQSQKLTRRDFLSFSQIAYFPVPTINRSRCKAYYGCDQCVRCCPQDAINKEQDVIRINREQCTSCGVCVSHCPATAMEFPGWSYHEVTAQISSLIKTQQLRSRPLLFVCHKAPVERFNGWLPMHVPCQAFITVPFILQCLVHGATVVAIHSCGESCTTGQRELVEKRVEFCRELLNLLGEAADRVKLIDACQEALPPPCRLSPLEIELDAPICLFGRDANQIIQDMVKNYQREDLTLEHSASPIGVVEIDPQTCTGCGTCTQVCPTNALCYQEGDNEVRIEFSTLRCIGCNRCVSVCPERDRQAISLSQRTDASVILQESHSLYRDGEIYCKCCGTPFATKRMVQRIQSLLGENFMPIMGQLCSECRVQPY